MFFEFFFKFAGDMEISPLFGNKQDRLTVIAGPCSAESREQMMCVARDLSAVGAGVLRAGAWKPRTRPGCFEGFGAGALVWISEAAGAYGMVAATEVAVPAHVTAAVDAGVRCLWIGARTVTNPFAVQEIADTLAAFPRDVRESLSVLVKNPVSPDLELWIGGLQRISRAGVRRLGAVHRGFYSPDSPLYRNLPEWRIPIELNRRYPELPVICDPSHIGGRRDLVAPLCQQALDLRFDGLIVECHPDPDAALSDAAQQITPARLGEILGSLVYKKGGGGSAMLDDLRGRIDRIDDELVRLLASRMEVSREIGALKSREGMPVIQTDRYNDLMQRRVEEARRLGLSPAFMQALLSTIHEESVRQQLKI